MEINLSSNMGKSGGDQMVWISSSTSASSPDDQWPVSSLGIKSYTCSFCKKGFSNAQALGGHMNIHRKDRAKLIEASDENLLSLDITKSSMNPSDDHLRPLQLSDKQNVLLLDSSEDDYSTTAANKDIALSTGSKLCICHNHDEDKKTQLSYESTTQIELDLELRLGPEPRETSSTRSTREFF